MSGSHLPLAILLALAASAVCRTRYRLADPVIRADTDASTGLIWKCNTPGSDTLHQLISRGHQYGLEILSAGPHTVHARSTAHNTSTLDGVGLRNCSQLASLRNLFRAELNQNWDKLRLNTAESFHSSFEGLIKQQTSRIAKRSRKNDRKTQCVLSGKCDGKEDWWFTEYHDVDEIYSWFEDLAMAHPDYVTVNSSIGRTHYDNDIMAVHVTDKSVAEEKIKVYFQCLLHAREWISGPICMYIARYFADPDPISAEILKQVEFIIVPVANPDGYHLTWLEYPNYRLWRKNAAPTSNPACDGVDLNRNFDAHWSLIGGSDDECSDVYHGPEAESELEVQAITNYIRSNAPIVASIDFHSYSQEILFPPAWKDEDVANVDSMQYLAGWMAYAASQVGEKYTSQSMHSVYLAAGSFPDWMLEQANEEEERNNCLPVTFTVELRPQDTPEQGYTGFMVPTDQILATCEEMIPAIVKFSHLVTDQFLPCTVHEEFM